MMSRRLVRRYGIPSALLLLGYVPTPIYVVMPIAALWIFWLIVREPPAQRVAQKLTRLAAIFLIMAIPAAILCFLVGYLFWQGGDSGEALGVVLILIGPWAAIPFVAGFIAMLVVLFQKRGMPTQPDQSGLQ